MNKIRQYFNTFVLTRGFFIALLSSSFIYLNHWGFSYPLLNTVLGLTALYLLLQEDEKIWFVSGAFIGLLWFWWIALSLKHYDMLWAIPIEIFIISLSYGIIFWGIAWISQKVGSYVPRKHLIIPLFLKALGLFLLSYIHPFSFDWFKPELMFIESYLGIKKWQFIIILGGIILSIWQQRFIYLCLVVLAYDPNLSREVEVNEKIALITTHTPVKDKWNKELHSAHFKAIYKTIDKAIREKKDLVILPESVFPVFLNRSEEIINTLQEKAKHISIITGALYWDGKTPRNSTYIFTNGSILVANKVVLVPFGESNPLPDFLSDWVNEVFYDGAVDYQASSEIIDYKINGQTYRNAICFEATSEKLFSHTKEGERPKNMIVLSNNGWFMPSTEPTLQKLLLQYYSKKYDTTIYHSINMSPSYIIQDGHVAF
ncbi:MAG TPA: apolipoprotein N-acyltransferase [Sulfurovum sp.]|nr:apolipoprotein N-acyltransferase [Sulfurovum sp.]